MLKQFVGSAEAEVTSVTNIYSTAVNILLNYHVADYIVASYYFSLVMMLFIIEIVWQGKNADALALYFGEDPKRCPFEQGT